MTKTLLVPEYGDFIYYTDSLDRVSVHLNSGKFERKWMKPFRSKTSPPTFNRGLYLGKRTVYDGYVEHYDDIASEFIRTKHHVVALVSPAPNKNPVYVEFEDITGIEKEGD